MTATFGTLPMLVLQCAMLVLAQDSDGTKLCNPTEMINVNTCCECFFARREPPCCRT